MPSPNSPAVHRPAPSGESPTERGRNPANVGSRGEVAIFLGAAGAVLAGLGLLFGAIPALAISLAAIGLCVALAGVARGLSGGRRGPAVAAAACSTFAAIMLVLAIGQVWNDHADTNDGLGSGVPDGITNPATADEAKTTLPQEPVGGPGGGAASQ